MCVIELIIPQPSPQGLVVEVINDKKVLDFVSMMAPLNSRACGKVVRDFGLGGGFPQVLLFPIPITTFKS